MSSDEDIIYDEDQGMFIINKINNLKEKGNLTTLTNNDIDILFNLANKEFNNIKNKREFMETPLKNIFTNLSDDKLTINKLMVLSYDYSLDLKKGNRQIIE